MYKSVIPTCRTRQTMILLLSLYYLVATNQTKDCRWVKPFHNNNTIPQKIICSQPDKQFRPVHDMMIRHRHTPKQTEVAVLLHVEVVGQSI